MHERQFDWLTHALPLEKLNILQLFPQASIETHGNPTEPQFSSAKDDVTPFKVNGDPSTLTDQRIPTRWCERSVMHTVQIKEKTKGIVAIKAVSKSCKGHIQPAAGGGPHFDLIFIF